MNKRNLLIVCLHVRDIKKIHKLDFSGYSKVIMASDDFRIHQACHKLNKIDEVTFLQKAVSYPKVYKNVIDMIDKVNNYFAKVSEKAIFDKKDLFWSYHVEGGYTTQRLQDSLLCIECAYRIFEDNMIDEIIIIGSNNSLPIKIVKRLAFLKGLKISLYNRRPILDKEIIRNFLRPIYYLIRSLHCKITSKNLIKINNKNIVLFQICGTSAKHIQNAIFPQYELLRNGFTPLNIMWGSSKKVKKINDSGYSAIGIEYYLKYSDIFVSLYKKFLVLVKASTLKNLFYETDDFIYRDINISDIVYESIMQYLFTYAPENFRYRVAAQRFAGEYSKNIVALKYCAVKSLAQGTILSEIIEDKHLKFDYNVGLRIPNLYTKLNSIKYKKFLCNNFLRFVPNNIEKKYLIEDMNVSENSVIKFGAGRAVSHFEKAKLLSKTESKKELGINKDYEIYLLFDFAAVIAGLYSVEESNHLTKTLIEFTKNNPDIALIIKPHPSANIDSLNFFDKNKLENIYIVDKQALPDHALNIADIMFCKFSTMGIEAMIYDVQVVSVLLDNENIFKVFGDAAEYIYSKKDLSIFLENTFHSKETLFQWKNKFTERRKEFISDYYPKLEKGSATILVEALKKNIK
jgi:hypothetical protein